MWRDSSDANIAKDIALCTLSPADFFTPLDFYMWVNLINEVDSQNTINGNIIESHTTVGAR